MHLKLSIPIRLNFLISIPVSLLFFLFTYCLFHCLIGFLIPNCSLGSESSIHRVFERISHLSVSYQSFIFYIVTKRTQPAVNILRDFIPVLLKSLTTDVHYSCKISSGFGIIICLPIVTALFFLHNEIPFYIYLKLIWRNCNITKPLFFPFLFGKKPRYE